jgi:hypothetical protein
MIMLFDFDTTMKLGLLFISPYLQSAGSNYGHGSKFAASGFIALISLGVHFNWFMIFKKKIMDTFSANGN